MPIEVAEGEEGEEAAADDADAGEEAGGDEDEG